MHNACKVLAKQADKFAQLLFAEAARSGEFHRPKLNLAHRAGLSDVDVRWFARSDAEKSDPLTIHHLTVGWCGGMLTADTAAGSGR